TSSIPKLFPSTPSTAVSHPQPGAESGNTLKKTPPDTATQACRKDTDVQHELFAEKQILGGQCRGRSECETEEDQSINEHMRSAVQEPKQSGETRHSRQNRTICKALDSRPTIEAISDFIFADDGPNAAETSHLASPGRQERRQRYRREAGGTGPPRRETVLAG